MARLVQLDLDLEKEIDLIRGNGFRITEPGIQGKDKKNMYGIQSPLFATEYTDENAFEERYSCPCGETKGKIFLGELCPNCKQKIEFRDVDFKLTGWIELKYNKIIQPLYYRILENLMGSEVLTDIIAFNKKVTRDGGLEVREPKSEWSSIGLVKFEEDFEDIITTFTGKKNKLNLIEWLLRDRDKVFISSIPVYSSVLRPLTFTADRMSYTDIDKKYAPIFSNSKLLNDEEHYRNKRRKWNKIKRESMTIPNILYNIQVKYNELWELIFDQIDRKEGVIKDEILGGMINFTARNVIVPDPTLRADEIRLNYMSMVELFKFEIIGTLMKIEGVCENDAYEQWFKAKIQRSQKVYEIMNFIIKKRKPKVLINRNPTINYGSIMCVRIISVKNDNESDYSMSMPPQILPPMNADFDGDILNIISLKIKEMEIDADKAYNPRKNMLVDRNDGLFNKDFNLYRDQLIGLFQFNNI